MRQCGREAFRRNLVSDGDQWVAMIKGRSMDSHTYNQKIADEIGTQVVDVYFHQIDNPGLIEHIQRVGRVFYRS